MDIKPSWRPSPNYAELRVHEKTEIAYLPIGIVIHITEGSFLSARDWFLRDDSDVSAHYVVSTLGEVDQFVDETDTAWANGRVLRPTWGLLIPGVNPNLYTLSIEHALRPGDVWPQAMLERSSMLIAEMHVRWKIPIDKQHVIGHHRIFAGKPGCPTPNSIVNELILMAQGRLQ